MYGHIFYIIFGERRSWYNSYKTLSMVIYLVASRVTRNYKLWGGLASHLFQSLSQVFKNDKNGFVHLLASIIAPWWQRMLFVTSMQLLACLEYHLSQEQIQLLPNSKNLYLCFFICFNIISLSICFPFFKLFKKSHVCSFIWLNMSLVLWKHKIFLFSKNPQPCLFICLILSIVVCRRSGSPSFQELSSTPLYMCEYVIGFL